MNNSSSPKAGWTIDKGQRRAALQSGIYLLLMAVFAGIAYGAIHGQLVVAGNSDATAANIATAPWLWGTEIALWLVIAGLDVAVSLSLFGLFAGTDQALTRGMAVSRILYTLVLGAGISQLFFGFQGAGALDAIQRFETIWYWGLIVFGIHLCLLAFLSARSRFIPWVLTGLLFIAGPAYTVIHVLFVIGGGAKEFGLTLQGIFMIPMTLGELGLALWLIILVYIQRRRTIAHADGDAALSGSETPV
ncbi:DUF4386 domain-containing protein [Spirochaeta lutea]|uniref:DUF4386 domain-containing protein n=1 Tax=Spirochaeta lutea TaxID=1480694 RepID=A0A098QWH1_9SPIO|nr:DUF4386 domain-containing protein [Spirochaeta lutea]KGE71891.1 hypothetical protein DC28_08720 [Spirochaeta lutea]